MPLTIRKIANPANPNIGKVRRHDNRLISIEKVKPVVPFRISCPINPIAYINAKTRPIRVGTNTINPIVKRIFLDNEGVFHQDSCSAIVMSRLD